MKNIIEKEFPILNDMTYLNTAASGLLPKSVMDFRREHDLAFFEQGSRFKMHQAEFLSKTREAVGRFFKCAPNHIALVPNFSFGFNTLLDGLPKSSRFLVLKGDYPSINWPIETRKFQTSYAEINEHLEDNIAEAFEKQQPDVFAFSIVQFISGIKIDLKFIYLLKQKYPKTLFFADGTQYCGTEVFDFESSGIDVLGASAYKWMNAGYGNGFFLFKDHVTKTVFPTTTGFNSSFGKCKQQDGCFIGKFEPGHQDTLNYGSLQKAIELIESLGLETIQESIATLSKIAKQEFTNLGLLDETVVSRSIHSSIFNLKGDDTLFKTLEKSNIICVQRGEGIRVGFHFLNTEHDLQRLLSQL